MLSLGEETQGNAAMFAHAETIELSFNRLVPPTPRKEKNYTVCLKGHAIRATANGRRVTLEKTKQWIE